MREFKGLVSVVLTPELRELAVNHVYASEDGENRDDLLRWFEERETPNGHVLEATTSEADAHMIVVIARALLWKYE